MFQPILFSNFSTVSITFIDNESLLIIEYEAIVTYLLHDVVKIYIVISLQYCLRILRLSGKKCVEP